FFAIRGRIKIESGESDRRIERFNFLDRITHWTTAVSFIILGLTGMNILWGKFVLLPVIGPSAFGAITAWGKYLHNYVAFAFMLGILAMFVLWVGHNLPSKYDLKWIAKGGGMFGKHNHPPARKFNAGQKVVFWATILGGISLSLSGIALLFPFETAMWGKTFGILSAIGLDVPNQVTLMEEQQLNALWHAAVGIVMIAIILAHIYIGTLGMEGAFDAMGTGYVDENWAREHHSIWVAEVKNEPLPDEDDSRGARAQPAE
ncbi:MAG: formate dehydrogenase subunit gamma, partial [Rhodovibrionaceae bacterium]